MVWGLGGWGVQGVGFKVWVAGREGGRGGMRLQHRAFRTYAHKSSP